MLEFKEVATEDQCRLQPMLLKEKNRGCEYTFGNVIIWSQIYATKVAYYGEGAVIRHDRHGAGYLVPIGEYNLETMVELMLEDAKSNGHEERFNILAAELEDFNRIEDVFPNRFRYQLERDYSEYVYLSENLRELQGKRYHNKRNHIARFIDNHPNYRFSVIDESNIDRVRQMNEEWKKRYTEDASANLKEEISVVSRAFDNFFDIGLDGGFIESNNEILAFSMGEPINDDIYCIHIEKAFHEVQGSYAIINREFARHYCKEHQYINREDDVGDEGLRKAKLSYYPDYITEKITIIPTNRA